jgi:ribonucleoside-triphosphate reductase
MRAQGGNPCLEQTLESYEFCCLVETFPSNHASLEDFLDTLQSAFLYAKTVTLGKTHWPQSNAIMLRNRRIGCGLSGVAQFISQQGYIFYLVTFYKKLLLKYLIYSIYRIVRVETLV